MCADGLGEVRPRSVWSHPEVALSPMCSLLRQYPSDPDLLYEGLPFLLDPLLTILPSHPPLGAPGVQAEDLEEGSGGL